MKKFLLLTVLIFVCAFSYADNNNGGFESSDSSSVNKKNTVDIYELQTLKLYPNPANDYLYIDYDIVFIQEAKLKIYNTIGAIIFSKTLEDRTDKVRVEISEYDNGIYFCSLQIDGKLLNTRKILINH